MILTKKIKTRISNNKKYYKEKGYKIDKKEIEIKIEDLPKNSHKQVSVKCDVCSKEKTTTYQSYNLSLKNRNYYSCSQKCSREKSKLTKNEKYGDENYNNYEKMKITKNEKYGNKKYNNSEKIKQSYINKSATEKEKIKEKIKETNLNKFGKISFSLTSEFKELSKKSCIEKFGKEYSSQNSEIKYKAIKSLKKSLKSSKMSLYDKYNITDVDFNEKKYEFKCKCGHNFLINYHLFYYRKNKNIPLCTICNPIDPRISGKELELINFIKSIYDGQIIVSDRLILNGKELDIYLPEIKIAFEFNGLYWHDSSKKSFDYHYNKTKKCLSHKINLFHIWEDEYDADIDNLHEKIKDIINKKYILRERAIKKYIIFNNIRNILFEKYLRDSRFIFDDGFDHIKLN